MSGRPLKIKNVEQSVQSKPAKKSDTMTSFIPASTILPEITVKGVLLGIILAMVLGAANAYLGLKMGVTITGCIPAAVVSMVVLRYFRNSNILENNMVQTIASAGEVIAAGLVFTLPAVVMMGYWANFNIFETTLIGMIGGILGVLFSVPLRRTYIIQSKLKYPEGVATAEVLKSGESGSAGAKELVIGGLLSATSAFMQTGLGICSGMIHKWITLPGGTTFGIGTGLSMALIGSGFVIGYKACLAMLVGSGITWVIGIPLYTFLFGSPEGQVGFDAAFGVWLSKMRFVGVGTFIVGGIWTVINIANPIKNAILSSLDSIREARMGKVVSEVRTEKDMPMNWVIATTIGFTIPVFGICYYIFENLNLEISEPLFISVVFVSTLFSLVVGFLCSCISAYMTGIVGSSNNPLSGVTIMGVILISTILYLMLGQHVDFEQHGVGIAAIIMMLSGITCCAAAVAGDNLQDLKTGQIVGSTPWKQQLMLIVGVIAGAITIGPILQLLYEAYGLTGSLPRPNMNPDNVMSAPKAALMAEIIKGVFSDTINWMLYSIGGFIAVVIILVDNRLKTYNASFRLPVLAVAIGIYLPYDVTTAALIGGFISFLVEKHFKQSRKGLSYEENQKLVAKGEQKGLLYAAGLIAGEALMAVALAIPFAIYQTSDLFRIEKIASNELLTMVLGGSMVFFFCYHFYKTVTQNKK